MGVPTYEDAQVLLKCAELYNAMELGKTSQWVFSDEFPAAHAQFVNRFPPDSHRYGELMRYVGFYETVATLWKNGLFNESLLLDWLLIPWDRVSDIAVGERAARGAERLWANFEALGARQRELFS